MTIKLVKKEDCRTRRRFNKTKTINGKKNRTLELVKAEDCSTDASLKAENMTRHEKGWAIKLGKIDIPKDDKRYSCQYYNKENNSCSEYKLIHCSNCKKNIQKKLPVLIAKPQPTNKPNPDIGIVGAISSQLLREKYPEERIKTVKLKTYITT